MIGQIWPVAVLQDRADSHIRERAVCSDERVVCERASRNGVNSLSAILALFGPKLENQRFPRARRRLHNHILALAQRADRLLLPQVRHGDVIEGRKG